MWIEQQEILHFCFLILHNNMLGGRLTTDNKINTLFESEIHFTIDRDRSSDILDLLGSICLEKADLDNLDEQDKESAEYSKNYFTTINYTINVNQTGKETLTSNVDTSWKIKIKLETIRIQDRFRDIVLGKLVYHKFVSVWLVTPSDESNLEHELLLFTTGAEAEEKPGPTKKKKKKTILYYFSA